MHSQISKTPKLTLLGGGDLVLNPLLLLQGREQEPEDSDNEIEDDEQQEQEKNVHISRLPRPIAVRRTKTSVQKKQRQQKNRRQRDRRKSQSIEFQKITSCNMLGENLDEQENRAVEKEKAGVRPLLGHR